MLILLQQAGKGQVGKRKSAKKTQILTNGGDDEITSDESDAEL